MDITINQLVHLPGAFKGEFLDEKYNLYEKNTYTKIRAT